MSNHLIDQMSPYLLQHADNPVNWYPWGKEAFERAKKEDKPVFLSIGYSTCHWCHVMAHESFEDEEVARILNQYFISIKVDKEERPDIDNIYMAVCQAFTGSGGWPTSIFMTPEQKPFYAATYIPKTGRFGSIGLIQLLMIIQEKWKSDRKPLLEQADGIISHLSFVREDGANGKEENGDIGLDSKKSETLIETAVHLYQRMFDEKNGGFGRAPKFPTAHNLLFLMEYYERTKSEEVLNMAELTLMGMYRGGIFDHIGGGFSRYSTDERFLVPHFEKMLYDNALLIMAYCKAYELTDRELYRQIALRCADFVLREMTSSEGGFYSAQDADSEGVEGKYYVFEPSEIINILGKEKGEAFNRIFDITEGGNFEGKSIPNLLKDEPFDEYCDLVMKDSFSLLYQYRKNRYRLHTDDKILTSWSSLMIDALCQLYRISGIEKYLDSAKKAQQFILDRLCEENTLFISYREGKHSEKGLLDDYSYQIMALLSLYEATFECRYLHKAQVFLWKVIADFFDEHEGSFFLSGKENETLILRPKETYDGAIFSGNSAMTRNLVQLSWLEGDDRLKRTLDRQLAFMYEAARDIPSGHAMFLIALLNVLEPPAQITIVCKEDKIPSDLSRKLPLNGFVRVLKEPTGEFGLKNGKTTLYICQNNSCRPPINIDEF